VSGQQSQGRGNGRLDHFPELTDSGCDLYEAKASTLADAIRHAILAGVTLQYLTKKRIFPPAQVFSRADNLALCSRIAFMPMVATQRAQDL
jgi:hypothetical protein